MISAMIAKRIRGQMEPVGTIDVHKNGFTFETEDKGLARLLERVQKSGVETMTGGGSVDERDFDDMDRVKITEERISPLTDLLLDHGYHWWEEE